MQCAFQKNYVKPNYNRFLLKKLIQNWHILICFFEKMSKKYPDNLVARYFSKKLLFSLKSDGFLMKYAV